MEAELSVVLPFPFPDIGPSNWMQSEPLAILDRNICSCPLVLTLSPELL